MCGATVKARGCWRKCPLVGVYVCVCTCGCVHVGVHMLS